MAGNICNYGRYLRQVAKVSISHVPASTTTAGTADTGGGNSDLAAFPQIIFKLSVQERYKLLRGTRDMMQWAEWRQRDEKDDYDGDDIEQGLVLVCESSGSVMEGVYSAPTVLFGSSTPAAELKQYLFRTVILDVMSSAVDVDRLDINLTCQSVCQEVVNLIEKNRVPLERHLIDQVHFHVDVLSREIETSDCIEFVAAGDPHYKQRRQVAKVSIHVPPTGTDPGDGFVLTSSRVLFKFTVQAKYRLLLEGPLLYGRSSTPCLDQHEIDDYDGDLIDQTLVLVDGEYHDDTIKAEVPAVFFSSSLMSASERDNMFRDTILQVMSSAVEDNRLKMETTYESVCKEMVDWVNNNLGSLERNSIEQVHVNIDVLTRDITDQLPDEDGDEDDNEVDNPEAMEEDGIDEELQRWQAEEEDGIDEELQRWQAEEEDGIDEELQRQQAEEDDAVREEEEMFRNYLIESALTPIIENDHDMEQKQQQVDDDNSCSICMNDEQNNAVQLQCSHVFHKPCIVRWLQQKTSCPMCRFQVIRYGDEETDD